MKRTPHVIIKAIQREQAERKRLEKRVARLSNRALAEYYRLSLKTVQRIEAGDLV